MMDGVLVVDKPGGMTSHDVVDEVRAKLGTRKVGHGGTLDPDATGVLVVGVGKATKLLSFAQASPKRYEAEVAFGIVTSTQDASGEVLEERPAELDRADVERELQSFVGDIEQIPPMVSAVRIGGERLHEKARRGEEVERPPRRVTVYEARVTDFAPGKNPTAELDIRCSSGTYVRTIAHDLGARLGCGAHLTSLRRTEAGGFTLRSAGTLDELGEGSLRPLAELVDHLPSLEVDGEIATMVGNGRPLPAADVPEDAALVAVLREGELLGVYRREGSRLLAERVIPR